MHSFNDSVSFYIIAYPLLSHRGPHHSASTWGKEKRWFMRGFYKPSLEVAPITLLTFHWAELRQMTTFDQAVREI